MVFSFCGDGFRLSEVSPRFVKVELLKGYQAQIIFDGGISGLEFMILFQDMVIG